MLIGSTVALLCGTAGLAGAVAENTHVEIPSPASMLQPNGRQLTPAGSLVELGNLPRGGAVTGDGRYLWTVSTGILANDIRIVDTTTKRVCQTLELPGASGGIAIDSAHHLAYISGLANSRWQPSKSGLPGVQGDVIHVFSGTQSCGNAKEVRTISVPPQAGAPTQQVFPVPRGGLATTTLAWPQNLAISRNGGQLLIPLNMADSAAIVDLSQGDAVRYVGLSSHPYAAAITPNGRIGLVTNEASGTVSVINMQRGVKLKDIAVGAQLSHPNGILIDPSGSRAYVAISASDQVAVINLKTRVVERTIWVGHPEGLGTIPTGLSISPKGDRLFVAESGADELAVISLPGSSTTKGTEWNVIGRIPTSAQPQAIAISRAQSGRPAQLMYVTAEGRGIGSNVNGPNPASGSDPIFWAFDPKAPTTDVFETVAYTAKMVRGQAGVLPLPTDTQIRAMTVTASDQLIPSNAQVAPKNTVLRSGGPIKHVFFIVRENRSYDQVLGDDRRGNGDPKLTVFGKTVTPNLHSLVSRFPLLDNVYANSEASIQGHYWTTAALVPDYVTRNWVANYGGRGRPNDFGIYAASSPGNSLLFSQAIKQSVSFFNYGEAFIGGFSSVPDRDRTPALARQIAAIEKYSDLGPPFNGCYPADSAIGTALNADQSEIFDSSMPVGAPAGSYSHVDCFRARFSQQLAQGAVPGLNYLSLTSDHTRGTQPGFPTPSAMVADSDLAIGQIVETISHSPIWSSSAIFIVEDDSQDGADHVNAHRIPVAVISPYAKKAEVSHQRYDLVSVIRSVELILGLKPLSMNDALATPMYDAFSSSPVNLAPISAIIPDINLLTRNSAASPDSMWSASLQLSRPDEVSQADLDTIIWHSVHGKKSVAPPPGPGAEVRVVGQAD